MERLRIGELLVQAKLLTQERLDAALSVQRGQGGRIGQVLVDLGVLTETQVTQALGQQLSVPWVSLYHIEFTRGLLGLVPRDVAERFCLVPIFVRRVRKAGETLYVAMDDPTNEAAIEAVKVASSLPVRAMIAAPTEIRGAIRVYYASGDPDAPAPPPGPPMTQRSGMVEAPTEPPPPPGATDASVAGRETGDPAPPEPHNGAARAEAPADAAPPTPPAGTPPRTDTPETAPEVEASVVEVHRREGAPMVALTLLDGTTIQLPTKPRRGHGERSGASDEAAAPASSGPRSLTSMTTVELVQALTAVANGADAAQVFGGKVPLEAICAALLRLLLRKGLIADWEVVEELRRKG